MIGFKKALSAIIDGNVTTLIAAVVLYFMGTGTVKGFAQTLALGIVVSLFTALVVTKLILNAFYAMGIRNEKFYGRAKETKVIDFLGKKKIFFILSAVVIIAGFVTMGVHKGNGGDALNYSLEFKGGTSTSVEFNEDMSIEELDEKVVPIDPGRGSCTSDHQSRLCSFRNQRCGFRCTGGPWGGNPILYHLLAALSGAYCAGGFHWKQDVRYYRCLGFVSGSRNADCSCRSRNFYSKIPDVLEETVKTFTYLTS